MLTISPFFTWKEMSSLAFNPPKYLLTPCTSNNDPLAFRHQMGWRNANQRHTSRLTGALHFAAILSHLERNIAGLERLVSDLIEISTRHHFALWQARGEIFGGWARSVSGSTAQVLV